MLLPPARAVLDQVGPGLGQVRFGQTLLVPQGQSQDAASGAGGRWLRALRHVLKGPEPDVVAAADKLQGQVDRLRRHFALGLPGCPEPKQLPARNAQVSTGWNDFIAPAALAEPVLLLSLERQGHRLVEFL